MKFAEINKRYTDKVAEYLAKGYMINAGTMGGSQGEISKIDLFKGTELIRVYIYRESRYSFKNEDDFYGDTVVLRVGKWSKEVNPNCSGDRTVWMNDLEIIYEETFYLVSHYAYYGKAWYVDDIEEARASQRTRRSRYKSVTTKVEITNDRSREIAGKYVKRVLGYKRLSWDKIKVFKVNVTEDTYKYVIIYGDTTLTLANK